MTTVTAGRIHSAVDPVAAQIVAAMLKSTFHLRLVFKRGFQLIAHGMATGTEVLAVAHRADHFILVDLHAMRLEKHGGMVKFLVVA